MVKTHIIVASQETLREIEMDRNKEKGKMHGVIVRIHGEVQIYTGQMMIY